MSEINDSFFTELERDFSNGSSHKEPIPIEVLSPVHGLMQYARELQGDLRQLDLKPPLDTELGVEATKLLDKRLYALRPQELLMSFVAIKSFALIDLAEDNKTGLFDFEGIHIVSGTPKRFIFSEVYERPTLSLTFENSEFLSDVPLAEENPYIPSDKLAIPVYSLRLDRD